MWTKRNIIDFQGFKFLQSQYHFWFWVQTFYAYTLIFFTTLELFFQFFKKSGTEKTQILFLLIAFFIPWIANIFSVFAKGIFKYLDFTPIAFTLTLVISSIDIYAFFFLRIRQLAQNLVYQNLKDIVLIIDRKDTIIEINPFARHFFKQANIQSFRGQKIETLFAHFQVNVQINRENEVVFVFSTQKKKIYFELSITRLKLSLGKNSGTLLILHNISDRIETEKRLSDQISKNKEQRDLLIRQARLASMGEMLGTIAHQWRQPLNALGLIIQDFKDAYEYGELNKEYLNNNVNRAMEQIQFLSGTIDDFRNFFKRNKEKEFFEIPEVIRSILKILAIQLKKENIFVSVTYLSKSNKAKYRIQNDIPNVKEQTDCPDCSFKIKSIPNEIKQILLNLINNSKDAILDQKKRSDSFQGKINICVLNQEARYQIEVQDNGGGIKLSAFDRIFEPYFSTKEEGKGSGIGLYMSKMIAENSLGGHLSAINQKIGATFILSLPKIL